MDLARLAGLVIALGSWGCGPRQIAQRPEEIVRFASHGGLQVQDGPPLVLSAIGRAQPAWSLVTSGGAETLVVARYDENRVGLPRLVVAHWLGDRVDVRVPFSGARIQVFAVVPRASPSSDEGLVQSGDASFDAAYAMYLYGGGSLVSGADELSGALPLPDRLRAVWLTFPSERRPTLYYDGGWAVLAFDTPLDDATWAVSVAWHAAFKAYLPELLEARAKMME